MRYEAFGKRIANDPSAKTGKAKKDSEAYEASAALSLAFVAVGTLLGTAVVACRGICLRPNCSLQLRCPGRMCVVMVDDLNMPVKELAKVLVAGGGAGQNCQIWDESRGSLRV